jgi:hypothetical protein
MPAITELRCVVLKEATNVFSRITAIVGMSAFYWVIRPAPGVFVIIDIMSEPSEPNDVLKIIPGHPPNGMKSNEPADNNSQVVTHFGSASYSRRIAHPFSSRVTLKSTISAGGDE